MCSCGQDIEVDWSTLPKTIKSLSVQCPNCNIEMERDNPYFLEITHTYPVSHHIFENFEMCKEENPDEIDFFEDTKNLMMDEINRAKHTVEINGIKVYRYLDLAESQETINDVISALGEICIYNRDFGSKDGKLVYSMELGKLDEFRILLIYNIIGILYHISNEGLPITVEISMDRRWEEIFESFIPIMDKVKNIMKGIEKYKIIYK